MSAQTENFALPIPDNRPESEQSGYAAILAVRNALIEIDALLKDQQDILGTKVGEGTTWEIADIDGLAAALAGKMAASKTFALKDLTDTAGVADAITGYVLAMMPGGKWSPASAQSLIGEHQHLMSDIQGLAAALAQKANAADLGNAAGRDVGTTAGTVAAGNDERIVGAVQKDGGTGLKGYAVSGKSLGNLTGSITPTHDGGNYQAGTIAGALTINAPTAPGVYDLKIELLIGAGAGAVTLAGFDNTDFGEAFTTSAGDYFILQIENGATRTIATVRKP